ncbi:MAG: hypothetical protein COB59_04635 [Rhodospirillaceae bacterium]|nr:MAG: hypothetical protein COB59_04635 [Rhodospirillaceae bacterium]
MHITGNLYLLGLACSLFLAALAMWVAKGSQENRGEHSYLTSTPIKYAASAGAVLAAAGVTKITVFSDFYVNNSMYAPV